jgi:hypothetical protein
MSEFLGELLNVGALDCLYFTLLGIGFVYALIVLITGGLHEVAGAIDVHLPADLHLPGDLGGAGPSLDHGEVGVPSLSPITIASFITAFGAFGLVATQLFYQSARTSLIWAAVGGLVVAVIAHFAFGYFLIAPQGSSEVTARDIIGATAEVITPIPAHSVGEIAFVAQGARVTSSARSVDGSPIERGTTVIIDSLVGNVAFVRPKDGRSQA